MLPMRDERTTTKTEARATQPMQWKLEAESRNCDHIFFGNCETQPPASIGWVALSSVVVRCSFVVCPASVTPPLISTNDVSEHTNHIFSVRIWSWQRVSVNISSVAELSPVYCCLVTLWTRDIFFHLGRTRRKGSFFKSWNWLMFGVWEATGRWWNVELVERWYSTQSSTYI